MVFSHGLGGSQNAYSHLCGSLASYGLIVIAPDHRDGSAPLSFIRDAEGNITKKVDYKPLPHTPSRKVEEARDQQLKIRLWELGMIHKILIQMDHGRQLTNFVTDKTPDEQQQQTLYSRGSLAEFASRLAGDKFPDQYKPAVTKGDLTMFKSKLDVHTPGKIAWAGHSFGAASVIQFVKTVYYSTAENKPDSYQPLYNPGKSSSLTRQITPDSPVTVLDLWTLPLESSATQWLWNRPLPCYAQDGPAGANLLAILSEAFFKWRGNLIQTKRILSANPAAKKPPKSKRAAPNIFYPVASAHLSKFLFPFRSWKHVLAAPP
jgi:platelet-activating factor acetylhydrolase